METLYPDGQDELITKLSMPTVAPLPWLVALIETEPLVAMLAV